MLADFDRLYRPSAVGYRDIIMTAMDDDNDGVGPIGQGWAMFDVAVPVFYPMLRLAAAIGVVYYASSANK